MGSAEIVFPIVNDPAEYYDTVLVQYGTTSLIGKRALDLLFGAESPTLLETITGGMRMF